MSLAKSAAPRRKRKAKQKGFERIGRYTSSQTHDQQTSPQLRERLPAYVVNRRTPALEKQRHIEPDASSPAREFHCGLIKKMSNMLLGPLITHVSDFLETQNEGC